MSFLFEAAVGLHMVIALENGKKLAAYKAT